MNKEGFIREDSLGNLKKMLNQSGLTYKSSEIEDILDLLDQSASGLICQQIRSLLTATRSFRRETEPEGIFAELRALSKTDTELNGIFIRINKAIENAEQTAKQFANEDNAIFSLTITYCKQSIKKRISSLPLNDPLLTLFNQSPLKQKL